MTLTRPSMRGGGVAGAWLAAGAVDGYGRIGQVGERVEGGCGENRKGEGGEGEWNE